MVKEPKGVKPEKRFSRLEVIPRTQTNPKTQRILRDLQPILYSTIDAIAKGKPTEVRIKRELSKIMIDPKIRPFLVELEKLDENAFRIVMNIIRVRVLSQLEGKNTL